MRSLRRIACIVLVILWTGLGAGRGIERTGTPVVLHAQPAQPPSQKEPMGEFVPLENLPPQEQMPAAPLVVAAYSFVWVALFVYLVSLARRMGTVQREVERLEQDIRQKK